MIQRSTHTIDIVPPVVIAEDRIDAERRVQAGEFAGPRGVRHALSDKAMRGKEITEHDCQITAQIIGGVDDLANPFETHIRATGVQSGNNSDGQRSALWPS